MNTKPLTSAKKKHVVPQNTIEAIKDAGSKMGSGMFDQLMGRYDNDDYFNDEYFESERFSEHKKQQPIKEFTVFNNAEYQKKERESREVEELTVQIKEELKVLKKEASEFAHEIGQTDARVIEAHAAQNIKKGRYDAGFFELILSFIRNLRLKVGESRTWLMAMTSKKAKRGSAFSVRSKKQGTQYSLSQELQSSRSVQ